MLEEAQKIIDNFDTSSGIKILNLAGLNLSPDDIDLLIQNNQEKFQKIKKINVAGNRLTCIPKEIHNLKHITFLNLHNNQIVLVPKWLEEMKNLKYLYLGENRLTSFPEEVTNLKKLINLGLSRNQIEVIPDSIGELRNLKFLYLRHNPFTSVPERIGELQGNIEQLDMRFNRLSEETITFLNAIFGQSVLISNLMEIDVPWEEILNQTSFDKNQGIRDIISEKEGLQLFLSKAGSSSLYNKHPDIVITTINTLLAKIDNEKDEEKRNDIIAEMVGQTGDCASPVSDYIQSKYVSQLVKEGKEVPLGISLQLALSSWITHNAHKLGISSAEAVEQKNGLINSITTKGSEKIESNKMKISNQRVEYHATPTTNFLRFAFNQVKKDTVTKFAAEFCSSGVKNGEYELDWGKLESLRKEYVDKLYAQENSHIMEEALSKIYKVLEDYDVNVCDGLRFYTTTQQEQKIFLSKRIQKLKEKNPTMSSEEIINCLVDDIKLEAENLKNMERKNLEENEQNFKDNIHKEHNTSFKKEEDIPDMTCQSVACQPLVNAVFNLRNSG